MQIRDRLPHLKAIIQYLPEPVDLQQRDEGVMSWEEFLEMGKDVPDYKVQQRIEQQKPGHCASLVFTSGTTGKPKVGPSLSLSLSIPSFLLSSTTGFDDQS